MSSEGEKKDIFERLRMCSDDPAAASYESANTSLFDDVLERFDACEEEIVSLRQACRAMAREIERLKGRADA